MGLRRIGAVGQTTLTPVVLVLSLLVTAMIGASIMRPDQAGADYTINAVYFAGASPVIDAAQTSQAGIRRVSSVAALQAEAVNANAVIVDRESMSAVSGVWLASQVRQGKLSISQL